MKRPLTNFRTAKRPSPGQAPAHNKTKTTTQEFNLSKGLNFTPMPPVWIAFLSGRVSQLLNGIWGFQNSFTVMWESDKAFDNSFAKFREKSTWSPPPNRDKFLDAYVSVITNEIKNAPEQRAFSNLSVDERAALSDLKANCDIVIREADKGSAVVVMDRDLYIKEGYRQLDDPQVYERVSEAVLSDIESEIAALAGKLYRADILTEDMFKFAIRTDTRPPDFIYFRRFINLEFPVAQ